MSDDIGSMGQMAAKLNIKNTYAVSALSMELDTVCDVGQRGSNDLLCGTILNAFNISYSRKRTPVIALSF